MKNFILVLCIILPLFAQAQEKITNEQQPDPYKFKIGGSLGYGGYAGFSGELYFFSKIDKHTWLRGSAKASRQLFNAKIGLRQELLNYRRFTFGSGVDLRYAYGDFKLFNQGVHHEVALMLPVTLDIQLTNRLSLNMDYNFHLKSLYNNKNAYNLSSTHIFKNNTTSIGLNYKF